MPLTPIYQPAADPVACGLQGITLQQRSICSHLCWIPWSINHVRWTKKFCQCHQVGYHRTGSAIKKLLQGHPTSEGRTIENTPAACGGCWKGLQIPCHPLPALPASSSSAVRQAAQNLSSPPSCTGPIVEMHPGTSGMTTRGAFWCL